MRFKLYHWKACNIFSANQVTAYRLLLINITYNCDQSTDMNTISSRRNRNFTKRPTDSPFTKQTQSKNISDIGKRPKMSRIDFSAAEKVTGRNENSSWRLSVTFIQLQKNGFFQYFTSWPFFDIFRLQMLSWVWICCRYKPNHSGFQDTRVIVRATTDDHIWGSLNILLTFQGSLEHNCIHKALEVKHIQLKICRCLEGGENDQKMANRQETPNACQSLEPSKPLIMPWVHMISDTYLSVIWYETRQNEIQILVVSVAGTILIFKETKWLYQADSSASTYISWLFSSLMYKIDLS
jgi:hypothetical protein